MLNYILISLYIFKKSKLDRITTKKTTQRDIPKKTVNKLIWNPEKCAVIS